MTVEAGAVVRGPAVNDHLVRRLLRNPLAVLAAAVLFGLVVVAVLSPLLQPFSPSFVQLRLTNAEPFTTEYLLGGDKFGRDILSRLIASSRGALVAVAILTSISVGLGVLGGLLAGYYGGVLDSIGTWVFAVLVAVPTVVILIAMYTVVGASVPVAMVVLGVLVSPGPFYLVRTLTRSVRTELYVDAARVSGLSDLRIVGRHVLMAIRAPLVVQAAFIAGAGLAIQAGLEFLGLGDPNLPSWGGMLIDAYSNVYIAGWQLIWPGLALGVTLGAFVLLGNAVRDEIQSMLLKLGARALRRRRVRLLGPDAVAAASARAEPGPIRPDAPLLSVTDLRIGYDAGDRLAAVVDRVSFEVNAGEVVGLVGESGSGKTQMVYSILGLLPDRAIVAGGSIRLEGRELVGQPERVLAGVRGTRIGYIPQEPMSNLDPSFRVGAQLGYAIRAVTGKSRAEARELTLDLFERVGITDPLRTFRSYPHEISGGMAQRALIAAAVAGQPRLLVADEPTTALDVTVQAEVLDLLRDLQAERGMGLLIVTHDFGVVADLCDRVLVMQNGTIVEEGTVRRVFREPRHPYTRSLLDAILYESSLRGEVTARV